MPAEERALLDNKVIPKLDGERELERERDREAEKEKKGKKIVYVCAYVWLCV